MICVINERPSLKVYSLTKLSLSAIQIRFFIAHLFLISLGLSLEIGFFEEIKRVTIIRFEKKKGRKLPDFVDRQYMTCKSLLSCIDCSIT